MVDEEETQLSHMAVETEAFLQHHDFSWKKEMTATQRGRC